MPEALPDPLPGRASCEDRGPAKMGCWGHHHRPASNVKPFSSQRALREKPTKVVTLFLAVGSANWAPAVNRQPFLLSDRI
eukprot:4775978-Pyramimonas_sp.AAC.1